MSEAVHNKTNADNSITNPTPEIENAEERANKEDFFIDFVERSDDELELMQQVVEDKKAKTNNNSKLPPKGKDFVSKQKQILREGVKHVTKATVAGHNLSKSMGERDASHQTRLMQSLMKEDRDMQVRRLEKFRKEEEERANRADIKKAERMLVDEKKWTKEVLGKIDLVPEDPAYYDKLAIKPGFDFFYALINSEHLLNSIRVHIPEILYFNYNSYLLKSDNDGKLSVTVTPKSEQFLKIIEAKAKYDFVKFWTEPATVVRSATDHPCYTSVNLLNWKQTYEHIRNGPSNRTMIQRYQRSTGDRHTIYRAVVHAEDIVNQKGSGKYNFAYALVNKVPFKISLQDDIGASMVDLQDGLLMDPGSANMEQRFLTCPFEVGSFDVYTYTGKTMDRLEKEAYKIFDFLQKQFEMRLYYLVTDWLRDDKGTYWFISLKSYKLKTENYMYKTLKPSAIDREILAINQHKKVAKVECSKCLVKYKPTEIEQNRVPWQDFLKVSKTPLVRDSSWSSSLLRRNKSEAREEVYFCDVCYDLLQRDFKLSESQTNIAHLQYIPKKIVEKKEVLVKSRQNAQRFRPKFFQWRLLILAQKLIDVDKELLDSKGIPIYLQCSFGEYVTRFQITDHGVPLNVVTEKVTGHVKLQNNKREIVSDSEPATLDELHGLQAHEKVDIVKINKVKVNYFFTENLKNLQQFLNTCEIEFRITFGPNWNNYLAASKGNFLNYFSNTTFQRGSTAQYSRNLLIFTDDLAGINLKFTIGLQLDQEVDMTDFADNDLKKYMGVVYLPPENYFSSQLCHNVLPPAWLSLIKEEDNFIKQKAVDIGVKLYAHDGRPYTKQELEKIQKYGHIPSKLYNATVAQRAGGVDELVDHLNGSVMVNKKPALTIPQQLALIQEKKKEKYKQRKAYVIPSMKAAFFKKYKLGQNAKAKNDGQDKEQDSELNTSAGSQQNSDQKTKTKRLQLRELFEEEGIKSSIGSKGRRSVQLVRLVGQQKTESEDEEFMEVEKRFNEQAFDKAAIEKIALANQRKLNPYNSKVQEVLAEERKEKEEIEKAALVERHRGTKQYLQRRGKARVERYDQRIKIMEEKEAQKKLKEELEKRNKIREEQKFKQLKQSLSNNILKNIRSVNYANFTTL